MSVAAATKIAGALWPAFRKLLKQIGRWLIRVMARRGLRNLLGYMACRVDVYEARLGRARTKRRKRWLTGRIRRWNAAMAWLKKHSPRIRVETVRAFEKLSEKMPDRVPLERFAAA